MTWFVVCVYFNFTDKVQLYRLGNLDSQFTKDEMTTKIKSLENSAASVVCNLSTHKKQQNYFMEDIIGVVALLGSVQSPELSRCVMFFSSPIFAPQKNINCGYSSSQWDCDKCGCCSQTILCLK